MAGCATGGVVDSLTVGNGGWNGACGGQGVSILKGAIRMKFGKLAVSLTAAAVMGAFAPVYAQNTSTYTTSSSSADELRNEGLNSDSSTSMRNTDDNAPPVVQQEQGSTSDQGITSENSSSSSDPATPQSGSSSSVDGSSSSGSSASPMDQDHDQTPPSGTYRTDSSGSGSGSAIPSEGGRQPAPY
jgi:hypothetical protein